MPEFDAAGIAVYALSYDEPDALRDFANAHNITYSLLPDPNSEVIRSFGILNTLIDPSDHPWYGIPYPGTYLMDGQGTITHKFFDSNLAVRAGPEQLLRAMQGQELPPLEARLETAAVTAAAVQVSVQLDGNALALTVQRELVASFSVPAGRHVYAKPAPTGSVAVDMVLDHNDALAQRPLLRPGSKPHTLVGTGERFAVHDGNFELRLPIALNGSNTGSANELTLAGEIRWQSCDDQVCDIPATQRFELQVAVAAAPAPALGRKEGNKLEPNAGAHFKRMVERRGT